MDRYMLQAMDSDEMLKDLASDSSSRQGSKAADLQPGLSKAGSSYRILLSGQAHGFMTVTGGHSTICPSEKNIDGIVTPIEPRLAELIFDTGATSYSQTSPAIHTETTAPVTHQRKWAAAQPVSIGSFDASHAEGVSALCRGEGWQSYADPEVARIGCSAPGVTTIIAQNLETDTVAGFAQVLSDGIAQGYLAQLIIHPAYRRIGLARKLVVQSYEKSGAIRLDLLTDDAQAFYETFEGHAKPGYRIYPDR